MLLLDEPTNYLDIHSIRWLKKFLNDWRQELILITHDRNFMNSVISHTLNIHRGIFKKTAGNTENVMEKILEEEEIYNKTVLNESKKREKTEEWIKRFGSKASMASRAQSKVKMYDFIFDKSADIVMLYSDKRFDISEQILRTILRSNNQDQVESRREKKKLEIESIISKSVKR